MYVSEMEWQDGERRAMYGYPREGSSCHGLVALLGQFPARLSSPVGLRQMGW